MNKFDVKVLLEETKKQTARDIIKLIRERQIIWARKCEELDEELESGKITFDQYKSHKEFYDGYSTALDRAIYDIEDEYNVGARKILEVANSKPE